MNTHTPHDQHDRPAIRIAILTISDTRTSDTDVGGDLAKQLLLEAGHTVCARAIVRDEPNEVRAKVQEWLQHAEIDLVLCTGGTGITSRDSTYEALESLLHKRLDGFGELFRRLSYDAIGPRAILSRALAGTVVGGGIVVALPGSVSAVELGLRDVLLPVMSHLVGLAAR